MQILQQPQAQAVKKIIKIALIVIGCLVIAAVLWGVISPLLGIDGGRVFGWQDYRYDETGYTVGEGSIPYGDITAIDLDWVDGKIEIVACDDTFISLTESADAELPDSAKLRWRVDENGRLSIKYRKSSWFLGFGHENRNKTLILRIPEHMLETLELLDVETVSSQVSIDGISVSALVYENVSGDLTVTNAGFSEIELESVSGDVRFTDCRVERAEAELVSGDLFLSSSVCPSRLDIESASGNVELLIPAESSFTLLHESASGRISSDFAMTKQGERYICGTGSAAFDIETASGDVFLSQSNDTD